MHYPVVGIVHAAQRGYVGKSNTSSMGQALITTEFRARVLVVDDEHAIAETLSVILAKSGFETAVAYDGREAVAKARNWRPDAIISDVVMPIMDGSKPRYKSCDSSRRARSSCYLARR